MNSFKIGLCSVTFRKKTINEVVELAKKAGVDYIEWGGDVHVKTLSDAIKAKELCDKENIKISSYGSYFNSSNYDEAKWREVCEISKAMEASSIRIWLGKKDSEKTSAEEYRTLLKNTARMCDVASEYGLLVCPECHGNTYNNNTDAFIGFLNELCKDNFKTYFQSRYFRMQYDLDRIDRTYSYIENVHVSYRDLKREQYFRRKDKNYLDTLLKKFKEKNFQGIVMVEFVCYNSEKHYFADIKKLKEY